MITNAFDLLIGLRAKKRLPLNGLWPDMFPQNDNLLRKLIQLFGAPDTGKSQLLYHLMARTVLPEQYGGKSSNVLFLDLTHKFNVETFAKQIIKLKQQYEPFNSNIQRNEINTEKSIVENCLKAITKIDCYSSAELYLTLNGLDEILSRNSSITLLAVDGLTAFFWEEFYHKLQSKYAYYNQLIKRFRKFADQHNICCIYTIDKANTITVKQMKTNPLPSLADYNFEVVIEQNGIHHSVNNIKFIVADDGIHVLSTSLEKDVNDRNCKSIQS